MNENSETNGGQRRLPSGDEMDALLRDFFRFETPLELNQPLRCHGLPIAAVATLTLAPEHHVEPLRSRSIRVVGVAASVVAMALAGLVLVSGKHELRSNGNGFAGRAPLATPSEIDKPMLVSPQGDSRGSSKAIGPDGLTLEETDSIELHSPKSR